MTLDTALDDLLILVRACRADHSRIADIEPRFENLIRVIVFCGVTAPAERDAADRRLAPSDVTSAPSEPWSVPLRCSVDGCHSTPPLYNVAAAQHGLDWRCVRHIPADVTFPIGLWGEDWQKSGRTPLKGTGR